MKTKGLLARTAVGAVGAMLLTGMAGAAIADEVDNDDVDVTVNIPQQEPVGALTMTVADDSTALTEIQTTDVDHRTFTGSLPTVTVTDDREEVPAGVFWYVLGQSSDFTAPGVAGSVGAERLGWTPALLTPGNGEVAEGDATVPSVDAPTSPGNNVGLEGEELLALALDSGEARTTGSWTANAALKLKADANVAPGAYAATITLTLWEDAQ